MAWSNLIASRGLEILRNAEATEPEPAQANGATRAGGSLTTRQKWWLAGAVATLVLGLLGRWLLGSGSSDGFLADWLPWLQGTDVTVYFGDPSGDYLVPVSRTLSGDDDNVESLANALVAGPTPGTGLRSVVPPETVIRSIAVAEDQVTVDLSGEFWQDPPALAAHALVHTLGSWPDVESVRVTVDGVDQDLGTGRLLFFYDAPQDMLVATPTEAATARDILADYLEGPGNARLTGLPPDVEVLQFESSPGSGLIRLNLRYTDSLRTMATDDGDGMRRTLEGLIATLTTGAPETSFVYLDFEGHATLGLGQCANLLRRVQPPPRALNDERLLDGVTG